MSLQSLLCALQHRNVGTESGLSPRVKVGSIKTFRMSPNDDTLRLPFTGDNSATAHSLTETPEFNSPQVFPGTFVHAEFIMGWFRMNGYQSEECCGAVGPQLGPDC